MLLTLACSGPGAEGAIDLSAMIGLVAAAVLLLLLIGATIAAIMRKLRWWVPLGALVLLLLDLAASMTLGVTRGDCGFTARAVSYGSLGLAAALALAVWWTHRRAR